MPNIDNSLSKEQIEYFKNSKVRDSKGNLLVCYHGTPTPGFKEFNPRNNKSQFGNYKFNDANVVYFTTDKPSATSYTNMGYEEDGNVYACYVNIVNPFIVDNKSISDIKSSFNIRDDKIRQKQLQLFDRMWNRFEDAYLDEENVDEINKYLYPLGCKLEYVEDDSYNLMSVGNNSMFGNESPILYEYSLTDMFDSSMYQEIKDGIIGEDESDYYLSTDDIVKVVLTMNEEDGTDYDGIIIEEILDSKNMFSSYGTDVITLKSSNQIKLISNKTPSSSNRIDEDDKEQKDMETPSKESKDREYIFDDLLDILGDFYDVLDDFLFKYMDDNSFGRLENLVDKYKKECTQENEEVCRPNYVKQIVDVLNVALDIFESSQDSNKIDKSKIDSIRAEIDRIEEVNSVIITNKNYGYLSRKFISPLTDSAIIEIAGLVTSNLPPQNSPSFLLPNGKFINVNESLGKNNGMHTDLIIHIIDKVFEANFNAPIIDQTTSYRVDIASDLLNEEFLNRGWARFNPGTTSTDDRCYCVLPESLTTPQWYGLEDFIDFSSNSLITSLNANERAHKDDILVYVKGGQDFHYFNMKEKSPNEIVKEIKRYYSSGYFVEAYLDDEEKFYDFQTSNVNGKDIFDTSKTGMSYYDNLLPNSSEKDYMRDYKNKVGEIVQMSPNEYYDICANKIFVDIPRERIERGRRYDQDTLQHLTDVITKYKRKFPMAVLDYKDKTQEGLHRMMVAGDLFGWDEKFPVLEVKPYGKKYEEQASKKVLESHSQQDGAIFKGVPFWSGSVNLRDGIIEEVHTFEEAENVDFHHSLYFSPEQVEKMSEGENAFFWVEDGEVYGEWRDEVDSSIVRQIRKQIKFISQVGD